MHSIRHFFLFMEKTENLEKTIENVGEVFSDVFRKIDQKFLVFDTKMSIEVYLFRHLQEHRNYHERLTLQKGFDLGICFRGMHHFIIFCIRSAFDDDGRSLLWIFLTNFWFFFLGFKHRKSFLWVHVKLMGPIQTHLRFFFIKNNVYNFESGPALGTYLIT